MFNCLISILCIVSMGANMNNLELNSIYNYFIVCDNMCVVYDNIKYDLNNNNVDIIKSELIHMCINSHEMPALGVSIHSETIETIKTGVWLIFKYNNTKYHNEMPFDELLISVNPEDCGFNIIRGNNGIYDGRCYYISLDNNMSSLYNVLMNIIK